MAGWRGSERERKIEDPALLSKHQLRSRTATVRGPRGVAKVSYAPTEDRLHLNTPKSSEIGAGPEGLSQTDDMREKK